MPTMEDWVDAKEPRHSPWSKTSQIQLWTSMQKKKKLLPMPTMSCNRYLTYSCNINATLVAPNWMMHIPCASYICKSEIALNEGMANQITIACFCFALCYTSLDWMIWKLVLPLPASYIGCTMYHERVCTCHFRIPPSWVRRNHNSRKSC